MYQPLVDLVTRRAVGVEALVRWRHPTRGQVLPLDFISIAEETGLIVSVGRWILQQACLQAAAWREEHPDLVVSVNLSPRQLREPALVSDLLHALETAGIPGEALELELTESMLVNDPQRAETVLRQLKATGVRLAIDDFGTGHSAMSYLLRYPFDTLKVDRSFVQDLDLDPQKRAIAQAVISLASSLQLATVAEGVETVGESDLLTRMGCDLAQGYLFARPESPEKITALLSTRLPSGVAPEQRAGVRATTS